MGRIPIRIPNRNKYGNKRSDDKRYVSKREAKRAFDLMIRQRIGEISELREQVRYELVPAQKDASSGKLIERAVFYVADFVYRESGVVVVEDTKGMKTALYIIKRKLMLWRHGIKIREV